LNDEFNNAWNHLVSKSPDSDAAKAIKEVQKALEANGMKRNDAVEAVLKKYADLELG
jgi:hypothetical protein